MSNILVTANRDLAAGFFEQANGLLHLSLEEYETFTIDEESDAASLAFNRFTFIIYGNLRNARYFMNWAERTGNTAQIQNRINLVLDLPTSRFLEKKGIPAILPRKNARPIDLLEFLLRITKEGSTLYPTTDNHTEEMPGLLKELEMPVSEFTVCREVSLSADLLEDYRERLSKADLDYILIHNRSSYTRIKTAFPDLNLSEYKLIAGSQGVTEKLAEEGLVPDAQAHGTWLSIAKVIEDVR
jgi:hypothetical protein